MERAPTVCEDGKRRRFLLSSWTNSVEDLVTRLILVRCAVIGVARMAVNSYDYRFYLPLR